MWENTIYDLADPYNTTIDVWVNCAISLGREGPGRCFTLTGLLRVKGYTYYVYTNRISVVGSRHPITGLGCSHYFAHEAVVF